VARGERAGESLISAALSAASSKFVLVGIVAPFAREQKKKFA